MATPGEFAGARHWVEGAELDTFDSIVVGSGEGGLYAVPRGLGR